MLYLNFMKLLQTISNIRFEFNTDSCHVDEECYSQA